jgi:hypothetical protein
MNHILPKLALNFIEGDALYDPPLAWQVEFLADHHGADLTELAKMRNAYIENPNQPDLIQPADAIKQKLRVSMLAAVTDELFIALLPRRRPILMAVEFFHLYFGSDGLPLPEQQWGFDGIVSNPPWETIKPIQREFAKVGKFSNTITHFEKEFNERLESEIELRKSWENYQGFYDSYSKFLRASYQYYGIGDLNYYKFMIERDLQLIKYNGILNVLVPSGIQTDKGCQELRHLLLDKNTLVELYSFENRGFKENEADKHNVKIFPDVDNRFKFTIVNAQKTTPEKTGYSFNGLFYLLDPREVYTRKPIRINAEMIEKFSPESFSVMEFEATQDYELCAKIRNEHPLLGNFIQLRSELHMANDADLFIDKIHLPKDKKNVTPMYEGKLIHQYNSQMEKPRYWVNTESAHARLLDKEANRIRRDFKTKLSANDFTQQSFLLNYQDYRLVQRRIASSTNERTLIATLLPPGFFASDSISYVVNFIYELEDGKLLQKPFSKIMMLGVLGLLNSLTLNYYIRNKISANASFFYMYELPIAGLAQLSATPKTKSHRGGAAQKTIRAVIEKSFALLYLKNPPEWYEALRLELGFDAPDKSQANPIQIRAELEIIIARDLYGLTKQDWDYLTSTFVHGSEESATRQELNEIIRCSKELWP